MSGTEPPDLVERGRRVLALEAAAIRGVAERLGPPFAAAVRLLAGARGRLIVSGVGKSGLRSEEHTSELQSQSNLVCRLLLEKKKKRTRLHMQRSKEEDHRC